MSIKPPPTRNKIAEENGITPNVWVLWFNSLWKLVTGLLNGVYGGFYQYEQSTTITVSVINTWYRITGNSATEVKDTAFASDLLTVSKSGKYLVNWSCSGSDGSGSQEFEIGVDIDGTVDNSTVSHITTKGASKSSSLSGTSILDITAGSEVGLMLQNTSSTNNLDIQHVMLTITKIGA